MITAAKIMAEVARSETSSPDTDKDFDPSADMMVHEYDDERTLDEEEEMASGEDCAGELDDLQKESEIPIEALLAQYSAAAEVEGTSMEQAESSRSTASSSEEEILESQNLTLDKEVVARDLLNNGAPAEDRDISVNELIQNVSRSQTERLLRSTSQAESDDSSSSSEDENYEPVEEPKKTIQVGSDFQAVIPVGLQKYGDAPAYENEDRLLWDPSKIKDEPALDDYLCNVQREVDKKLHAVANIPRGRHIRDDEQALFLLLQCDNNIEEAERRRKMQAVPPTDVMSLWSEDECRNFEDGLRLYGKNFHEIHHNKVRTRSVFELVHFYYLWKKTERHDVFAAKTRAEKRKYSLNPGVMDHMDRFLEEQDIELHQLIAPHASSESRHEHAIEDANIKTNIDLFTTGQTTVMSPSRHVERNTNFKGDQSSPSKRVHHHSNYRQGDINGSDNLSDPSTGRMSPKKLKGEALPDEPLPKKAKLGSEPVGQDGPNKLSESGQVGACPAPQSLPSSTAQNTIKSESVQSPHVHASSTQSSATEQQVRCGSSGDAISDTCSRNESPRLSGTSSPGKAGKSLGSSVSHSLSTDISNGVLKAISADGATV